MCEDAHALKNPYPLWQMVSAIEHNLYVALSTGDKKDIKTWAELLRDFMNDILEEIKE